MCVLTNEGCSKEGYIFLKIVSAPTLTGRFPVLVSFYGRRRMRLNTRKLILLFIWTERTTVLPSDLLACHHLLENRDYTYANKNNKNNFSTFHIIFVMENQLKFWLIDGVWWSLFEGRPQVKKEVWQRWAFWIERLMLSGQLQQLHVIRF